MKRLVSLGLLLIGLPRPALADPQRVSLLLPGCELPGASANELRRALALELQSEGLVLSPAGELSPERDVQVLVEASCPAPDQLTLRAQRGAVQQLRTFRLSDLAAEQRPRALSLSISELASLLLQPPAPGPVEPEPTLLDENEATPATPPPAPPATTPPRATPAPTPPPATPPSAPSAASSPARVPVTPTPPTPRQSGSRLAFAPELRFFPHTFLWGARAQLARAHFRYAAGLLLATSHASAGRVLTRLVHGSVTYAFPVLGQVPRSLLETGPRLGVGYTFMSARASGNASANDARDWYADLAWTLSYSSPISRSLRLGLGAELGYGRGPIGYADNLVVAQTSGPFASLLLECSLDL